MCCFVKFDSFAMLSETSYLVGSHLMAYLTKEIKKIELFQLRVCTKVGFGSCSACINIQLTNIHGYLVAPFSRVLNRIVY